MNTRRSTSSRITDSAGTSRSGSRNVVPEAASRWSRVDSRRITSIALRRAATYSHPVGLLGIPVRVHTSIAATEASCTASSAS
ncbi:MAG: hypothetical protein WKF58_16805 [Ilumatobacteraceae bacterium]